MLDDAIFTPKGGDDFYHFITYASRCEKRRYSLSADALFSIFDY